MFGIKSLVAVAALCISFAQAQLTISEPSSAIWYVLRYLRVVDLLIGCIGGLLRARTPSVGAATPARTPTGQF